MKIFIEVNGGAICNIVSTEDCKIYILDHDNMREKGWTTEDELSIYSPATCTGELDSDDNDETPEFDKLLAESLSEYDPEEVA